MHEGGYYEAYTSVFGGEVPIRFNRFASDPALLEDVAEVWHVQRLQWFARGFYSVVRMQHDLVISDLRMGIEPHYVFRFKVGEIDVNGARATAPVQLEPVRDLGQLPRLWARIWDPTVDFGAKGY